MNALLPRLTTLDQRVLDRLPEARSVRSTAVVEEVVEASRSVRGESREHLRERLEADVRSILRGLGHLGVAEHRGGGWWRRVPP